MTDKPPADVTQLAERLISALADADYEYEPGERARIHAGRTPDRFVVEYPDGEEYLVTVSKVKP